MVDISYTSYGLTNLYLGGHHRAQGIPSIKVWGFQLGKWGYPKSWMLCNWTSLRKNGWWLGVFPGLRTPPYIRILCFVATAAWLRIRAILAWYRPTNQWSIAGKVIHKHGWSSHHEIWPCSWLSGQWTRIQEMIKLSHISGQKFFGGTLW